MAINTRNDNPNLFAPSESGSRSGSPEGESRLPGAASVFLSADGHSRPVTPPASASAPQSAGASASTTPSTSRAGSPKEGRAASPKDRTERSGTGPKQSPQSPRVAQPDGLKLSTTGYYYRPDDAQADTSSQKGSTAGATSPKPSPQASPKDGRAASPKDKAGRSGTSPQQSPRSSKADQGGKSSPKAKPAELKFSKATGYLERESGNESDSSQEGGKVRPKRDRWTFD